MIQVGAHRSKPAPSFRKEYEKQRLGASQDYCWDSWPKQTESMQRLLQYRFEWVLPGHGQRVELPADELHQHLAGLVELMRK
jgi:glyoxylase-like metal-dependent hydrolase (beta-lactamase superfamily II)